MSMFCYQCEQTAKGTGCVVKGICGKDAETASLQDLLIHAAKGISRFAARANALGAKDHGIDHFVVEALFTTITNVNFDPVRLQALLAKAVEINAQAKTLYEDACKNAGKTPDRI